MAKFNFTLVKGTDINANLEVEASPAEVAQMLAHSRESMKEFIGLLNEAKSSVKEFYTEFKPMIQRRAGAALDRDNASWGREEEEKQLRHEIEMEKLRLELAELKTKSTEKAHEEEVERISRNINDGDFSRRIVVPADNDAHSRRIAETTATVR